MSESRSGAIGHQDTQFVESDKPNDRIDYVLFALDHRVIGIDIDIIPPVFAFVILRSDQKHAMRESLHTREPDLPN